MIEKTVIVSGIQANKCSRSLNIVAQTVSVPLVMQDSTAASSSNIHKDVTYLPMCLVLSDPRSTPQSQQYYIDLIP